MILLILIAAITFIYIFMGSWSLYKIKETKETIMFIILKPDANLDTWLKGIILLNYDINGIFIRYKNETWVRQHYNHLTEEPLNINIELFTYCRCEGIDINVTIEKFNKLRQKLRDFRIIDPRFLHRNQIHVPDNPTSSNIERELFLDETTNRH